MNIPDQHTILSSLNRALVPGATLVDGRTERDRLAFMADFASLINFYDHTNQVNGNWRPFLLKDPVFLLAHISSIRFNEWQGRFQQETKKLQILSLSASSNEDLASIINRLSEQIINVFLQIERWTVYMQQSFDYDLKKYVLYHVKNNISEYFWAFLSFCDAAYRSAPASGLERVEYAAFSSFDELTWKISRGKRPFWEVLQISEELVSPTQTPDQNLRQCYQVMNKAGETLFGFLHTIVRQAPKEFERVKKIRSHYPDTTLIRAFEKLLRIYQEEQNKLSEKHLSFYYGEILKQSPRKAVPDTVFVCAVPSGNSEVTDLKAGLLLNGGFDANSNPILFETKEDVSVNPASIAQAFTVSYFSQPEKDSVVYLQSIQTPDQIVKNEGGMVTGWPTFGHPGNEGAVGVKAGLILASPILLLQEGDRTITIQLKFDRTVCKDFFVSAAHCLSTSSGWSEIGSFTQFTQPSSTEIQFCIKLSTSHPAIVSMTANAEGVSSVWPMLKMEFGSFPDPSDPPIILSANIHVAVSKLKNLQLFNDNGGISPKGPFAVFGNIAQVNSHFIIGSTEVFSKPLNSLYLEFTWDKSLPKNFQNYYQPYNDYINSQELNTEAAYLAQQLAMVQDGKSTKGILAFLAKAGETLLTPLKKIADLGLKGLDAIVKLFQTPGSGFPVTPFSALPNTPFNNVAFTVGFSMLDQHTWNPLNLGNMTRVISPDGDVSFIPYQKDGGCVPKADGDTLLFKTQTITVPIVNPQQTITDPAPENNNVVVPPPVDNSNTCLTLGGSYFGLANPVSSVSVPPFPFTPEANIQQTALSFSEQSSTGFIRMTLTGPSYGFGTAVYPNVVSNIALKNALILSKKPTNPPTPLNNPANQPFVPKVSEFQLHYSASVNYFFDSNKDSYPIQCFSISPIANGDVYQFPQQATTDNNLSYTCLPGSKKISGGIPLFPAFPYNGSLFMAMENVIAPAPLNLYFQLANNFSYDAGNNKCHYAYLSNNGWKSLPLLADGTRQYGCSGIVKVNLPADISQDGTLIGTKKAWISIGVKGDPSGYSDTVFLKVNGICASRSGSIFQDDKSAPVLAPGQITRPVQAVPQIAAFLQPFASFGGKAAEDNHRMNQRISTRLKTKDRVVTSEDIFRLIKFHFPDVFYVKSISNTAGDSTLVYVVPAIENSHSPNAYLPLITECRLSDIQLFLQQRASTFSFLSVLNFSPQYLEVEADIDLAEGYQLDGVTKKINQGLGVFLSPWINCQQAQIKIDQGVSDAAVASFISGIDGVAAVNKISFNSWILIGNERDKVVSNGAGRIKPVYDNMLIVPVTHHSVSVNTKRPVFA
jgi:hypothetical protein